jgi:hypothetical protein
VWKTAVEEVPPLRLQLMSLRKRPTPYRVAAQPR